MGRKRRTQKEKGSVAPRQKRSIQSRDKIFRAAQAVFSEKGLHGARIDEIARLADVNKQRIYAYFASKRELYRQVLIDVYTQAATHQRLMELDENDIPQMTGVIINTFLDFHEQNPMFWRLLCWENLNGGKAFSPADWRAVRSAYIRHLEKLYTLGQAKRIFRKDADFTTYLMLLFSATYFYYSNQLTISHLLNLKLKSGAVRQRIESQLLAIITDGIGPH